MRLFKEKERMKWAKMKREHNILKGEIRGILFINTENAYLKHVFPVQCCGVHVVVVVAVVVAAAKRSKKYVCTDIYFCYKQKHKLTTN